MNLLQASIASGLLILIVAAVRLLGRNRLPARIFPIMWGIVLLRLLLPFTVPLTLPSHSIDNQAVAVVQFTHRLAAYSPLVNIPVTTAANPQAFPFSLWTLLWISGLAFGVLYFGISYLRARKLFSASTPVQNEIAAGWLAAHPLHRKLRIHLLHGLPAPLTYGILRPVILLPEETDWTDTEWITSILEHEFAHIRCFDTLLKFFLNAALCLHWFNPLVWLMRFLAGQDLELACDEAALHRLGGVQKSSYALTLIGMEERRNNLGLFCGFGKNNMEGRIRSIMKFRKKSRGIICIGVFLTAAVLGGAVLGSLTPQAAPELGKPVPHSDSNVKSSAVNEQLVTYESAQVLYYDSDPSYPYLHDVFTNHTDHTIVAREYCILAYDEKGNPLRLYWNPLDSSESPSYDCLVDLEERVLPGTTNDIPGGWSLSDGEQMSSRIGKGDNAPNRVAYGLYCIKRLNFEDGSSWENPDYQSWLDTYLGKQVDLSELQSYYPCPLSVSL